MSFPITLSQAPAFGFETAKFSYNSSYSNRNKSKCLSYIPFISMFIGIGRMHDALIHAKTLGCKARHIIRGTIEFLNLGVLLLLPDLILTVYRKFLKPNADLKLAQPLTPETIKIGSELHPLNEAEIIAVLEAKQSKNGTKPIDIIFIYAKNCEFFFDPGFIPLKPNKVILVGGNLMHVDKNLSGKESLSDQLQRGWYTYTNKTITEAETQSRPIYHDTDFGELAQCLYIIPAQTPAVDALP